MKCAYGFVVICFVIAILSGYRPCWFHVTYLPKVFSATSLELGLSQGCSGVSDVGQSVMGKWTGT